MIKLFKCIWLKFNRSLPMRPPKIKYFHALSLYILCRLCFRLIAHSLSQFPHAHIVNWGHYRNENHVTFKNPLPTIAWRAWGDVGTKESEYVSCGIVSTRSTGWWCAKSVIRRGVFYVLHAFFLFQNHIVRSMIFREWRVWHLAPRQQES